MFVLRTSNAPVVERLNSLPFVVVAEFTEATANMARLDPPYVEEKFPRNHWLPVKFAAESPFAKELLSVGLEVETDTLIPEPDLSTIPVILEPDRVRLDRSATSNHREQLEISVGLNTGDSDS
jgi:hypothetical protein